MNQEAEEYINKVMMPLLDSNLINDEEIPVWVRNIIKHFHLTGVKKLFDAIGNEDFGSHGIGLMVGSLKHIITILEDAPELDKDTLDQMKGTELDKKLDQAEEDLTEFEDFIEIYQEKISKGSNHEESKYLEGKSEGLQLIKDEEGQIKGARDNTTLLVIMYLSWPVIEENCRTRRELYEYLLKMFWKPSNSDEKFNILMVEADPPSIIGTYERVQKILKRIGFNPSSLGRPKKN